MKYKLNGTLLKAQMYYRYWKNKSTHEKFYCRKNLTAVKDYSMTDFSSKMEVTIWDSHSIVDVDEWILFFFK